MATGGRGHNLVKVADHIPVELSVNACPLGLTCGSIPGLDATAGIKGPSAVALLQHDGGAPKGPPLVSDTVPLGSDNAFTTAATPRPSRATAIRIGEIGVTAMA